MLTILHMECIFNHYVRWQEIISLFWAEIYYNRLLLLIWKFCSHYFFKGRYTCMDKIHTIYPLIYNAPNDIIDR